MFHTNLVTDLPELPKSGGGLVELHPGFKIDGVDHEVGMDMLGIAMSGHLYLMPRPGFGGKLQTDGVCLLVADILPGRKGLNVLVEIDAVQLVIGGLSGQKFCEGVDTVAVQPGHISDACFGVSGLVLPLAIPHHSFHSTDMLLSFLDVGYSCHPLPPMRISSS